MLVRLEIEIMGEILHVRESSSSKGWSSIYPGQKFNARGAIFQYEELRSLGNGKHEIKRAATIEKNAVEDLPD